MSETLLVTLTDVVALNDPSTEFDDESVGLVDTDAERVDDADAEAQRDVKVLTD